MAPRSGLDKTAFTAVLHGSMFSSPCAKAHQRTKSARPRKRRLEVIIPYFRACHKNRMRFCMVQCFKFVAKNSARRARGAAAAGLRLLYGAAKAKTAFTAVLHEKQGARPCEMPAHEDARQTQKGGLEVIIPYFRLYVMLSPYLSENSSLTPKARLRRGGKMTVRAAAMAAKTAAQRAAKCRARFCAATPKGGA